MDLCYFGAVAKWMHLRCGASPVRLFNLRGNQQEAEPAAPGKGISISGHQAAGNNHKLRVLFFAAPLAQSTLVAALSRPWLIKGDSLMATLLTMFS